MLALYFSGTGNTKFIAELFSEKMDAACVSIESDTDFSAEIKKHDIVAVCYPVYFSRVPLIMRQFAAKHRADFAGKRLIIFATQFLLSGDGARAFCDLLPENEIIYAEHFFMPNNVCNTPILPEPGDKTKARCISRAEKKMSRVCENIRRGKIVKRGFSVVGRVLGLPQGLPWQRDTSAAFAAEGTLEREVQRGIKITPHCTACGACISCCPTKNLQNESGRIAHRDNCTACYRCVNLCPERAITLIVNRRPKWQYKGLFS